MAASELASLLRSPFFIDIIYVQVTNMEGDQNRVVNSCHSKLTMYMYM